VGQTGKEKEKREFKMMRGKKKAKSKVDQRRKKE